MRDGLPVAAAFWLRANDEDRWHLYIASKVVDEQGPAVYRKVQASLSHLPGLNISLAEIKLIEATAALTHDVLKIRKHYSGTAPIQFGGAPLGGLLVEEALIYPPIPLEKGGSYELGKRRLKTAVQQTAWMDDIIAPMSPRETDAYRRIVSSGVSPAEADYWVRKKREMEAGQHEIPAGALVDAFVAAWWGDNPQDDSNPLLRVKTGDGAEGLTFLDNTEPV